MSQLARVGDQAAGTCYSHKTPRSVTGTITTGDNSSICNNQAIACVGDIVTFDCGHTGTISTGVDNCILNNKAIAHVGSLVTGPMIATIISGDPNTTIN